MTCNYKDKPVRIHRKAAVAAGLLVASLFIGSCSSSKSFLHEETDPDYYERVAVVPFESLSNDRLAGDKMTLAFVSELFASGKFEIVEPGLFREILRQNIESSRRDARQLVPEELKLVGEVAGVQGIFEGFVREFEMVRIGQDSFPLITLEIRFLDAATGLVIWSTSVTSRGGPKTPIFGWGETHTLGELSNKVAAEAVGRLPW